MTALILASSSLSRQRMLRAAGVPYQVSAADLNEAALIADLWDKGEDAASIAAALAEQKAVTVSRRSPGALVLGGDSVLAFGGEIISKCRDLGELRILLQRLSGKKHQLISAAVLARDGAPIWHHTGKAELTMRKLSPAFLDSYLTQEGEKLLSSVGGYQYEGRGAQLFDHVEGDAFTILGLPLLPVLAALRVQGSPGSMKRAGIIGWPVSHSLSPLLHGYWLKEHGIEGEFVRLPARPEEFTALIDRLRGEGFAGVNVTVPHKEAAFKLAARRDRASEICGAVNLLVFDDAGIAGRNTNSVGMHKSLEENHLELGGRTVVLLGAGGAARGAILALDEMGAAQIHILNRRQARAESLAHALALNVKAKLVPGPFAGWPSIAGTAGLLLNTSSAGMTGNEPLEIDLSPLPKDAAVCDIVYNPLQTGLLKDAAARGHKVIDGLGMLMHQAVPSFEAFFGIRPAVTPALRAVLEDALNAR